MPALDPETIGGILMAVFFVALVVALNITGDR